MMKINSLLRRSHEAATRCSCSVCSKIRRRRRSRSRSRRPSKKIKNNSCLFLELLPVEITADIFSRLHFDSVLQCKLVCKTWRDLLNNNNNNNNSIVDQKAAVGFLLRKYYKVEPGIYYGEYDEKQRLVPTYNFNLTKKTILNHQYPFEDIENWYVVGSCNGLICLWRQKDFGICTSWSCKHGTDRHHHDMYVCNPYTGEYAKLPGQNHPGLLIHLDPRHLDWRAYGFGYHPITKEYKVIRIYYQRDSLSSPISVHGQVYTLGSDTYAWRSIGEIKHDLVQLHRSNYLWGNDSDNTSWGIPLNGVLYWLSGNATHIISFDLADEEFRRIWTTPNFLDPSVLGVLNGCLCFSIGMNKSTHIWVMNNNDYSWSKKFSISWRKGFKPCPLAQLESGKILLQYNFNKFCSYNPETKHAVKHKMRDKFYDIIPYMKCTVSLKALGETLARQVTAIPTSESESESSSMGDGDWV